METLKHRAKRFLVSLKPGKAVATVPETGTAVSAEMGISECPNCHAPLDGTFCNGCGQKNISMLRPIWFLVADLTEDIISKDSKLWRTLGQIIFLPGTMTRDFMDGRRARFLPPIRLYLLSTLMFFVSLFVTDIAILKLEVQDRGEAVDPAEEAVAFNVLQQGLAAGGVILEPDPDAPEQTFNEQRDAMRALEDLEGMDPEVVEQLENLPPEVPEDVRQTLAEVGRIANDMRDIERRILEAVENQEGVDQTDLKISLRELSRLAERRGMRVRLADDASQDQLTALGATLEDQIDSFDEATDRDASFDLKAEGRYYGVKADMFVPAATEGDVVALPESAFDEQKESLDRSIVEHEQEGFQHFVMVRARQALDGAVAASANPYRLNNALNDWLSRAMIVLLPIFAFLLRFFYWGKENNLMKQFVFSLHFHTYIFLVMTFLVISQSLWGGAVSMNLFFVIVPLYLLVGMKVASKQGWIRTFFKFAAVSFFYLLILSITVFSTLLMSFADI